MTLVNISLLETILGGFGPVTSGKIRVTYWAGSAPYLGVVDEEVRFPSTITVDAAGGHASVDLVPTGGVCCVRWEITDARNRMLIRHTTIPDVPVVAFGDLVDVDPLTFEPSDAGRAAWEATLAEVQTLAGQVAANTITATISPDDPRLLRISYPAFASPRPGVVRIPLEA